MSDAIRTILSGIPGELFYGLLGALTLFILQKIFHWGKRQVRRLKIKSEIKHYQERLAMVNVIDLVNGVPEIKKEDILFQESSRFGETTHLFVDMLDEHQLRLREKEQQYSYRESQKSIFHQDCSFDGGSNFADIASLTHIPDLPSLIDKHRKIVGEQYLKSFNGLLFNDDKFGILNFQEKRFGKTENSGVEIDLFTTDYFTHRVFRSIYQELKESNHPIKTVNLNNFLQYRPFLTSFGINTLLICEGVNGKEIILSKRSSRVHGNKARYHITMNEGLNLMDRDSFGTINLESLLQRGLKEELGIDGELYDDLITKAAFYDLFLEKNKFEIGITSLVVLDVDFTKFILPLIAKDKHLEFDSFVTLRMQEKEIKTFIRTHEFIPHGLYTLDRVLLREKIFHTSLLI